MKSAQPQACPLCQSAAEYYFVDGGTRKHFLYGACTQFQIEAAAETRIARAAASLRTALSERARSHPKGATLVITGKGEEESTNPGPAARVGDEYVENSQLPG